MRLYDIVPLTAATVYVLVAIVLDLRRRRSARRIGDRHERPQA